jgi:hypothetical protein
VKVVIAWPSEHDLASAIVKHHENVVPTIVQVLVPLNPDPSGQRAAAAGSDQSVREKMLMAALNALAELSGASLLFARAAEEAGAIPKLVVQFYRCRRPVAHHHIHRTLLQVQGDQSPQLHRLHHEQQWQQRQAGHGSGAGGCCAGSSISCTDWVTSSSHLWGQVYLSSSNGHPVQHLGQPASTADSQAA